MNAMAQNEFFRVSRFSTVEDHVSKARQAWTLGGPNLEPARATHHQKVPAKRSRASHRLPHFEAGSA